MATVARLNQIASKTPPITRKRPRTSDENYVTPQKRQALVNNVEVSASTNLNTSTSRSVSRLRSRNSLPVSTPVQPPRRGNVYDVQESPKDNRKSGSSESTPHKDKKVVKKKRLLNRKVGKKPVKGHKFDERRKSAFDPLRIDGVTLTTADSPAKNTRTKREQPLVRLHPDRPKSVMIVAESGETLSELNNDLEDDDQVVLDEEQQGRHTRVGMSGMEEEDTEVHGRSLGQNRIRKNDNPDDDQATEGSTAARPGKETGRNKETWVDRLSGQDLNYTRRQYEEAEREKRKQSKAGDVRRSEIGQQRNVTAPNLSDESDRGEPSHQVQAEDAVDEDVEPEAPQETRKRKSRPKMSDEERQARKEAEAQRRQENAIETEEANLREWESYGKDFVEDIKDSLNELGGLECWSAIGAGAKTITSMVGPKKSMDEARAEVLWIKLTKLKHIFSGKADADEDRIKHLLSTLKAKSTPAILTRNETIKKGDTTIIDLYEHIIPQSVHVLKYALKARFVATYKISWQELLLLVGVAISLCDIATDWKPRPTTIETGIRQQVRHHIRPNLVNIQNVIKTTLDHMEFRERRRREMTAFSKLQQMKREQKRQAWERMNQELAVSNAPQSATHVVDSAGGQSPEERTEDIEIDDSNHFEGFPPETMLKNPAHRPVSLQRQATEEIPAPDPNTTWSEIENVALLNGLQTFLGANRYTKLLGDPRYAKVLRDKDIDQCIARARYYKAGCGQILQEKQDNGDSSFDWLRTV